MDINTATDNLSLALIRIDDGLDYYRAHAETQRARYASELDYLTRSVFKTSVESALRSIAKMIEDKPVMLMCMEKDLSIAATRIIQADEDKNLPEQFEVAFEASMYYGQHERDWTPEEAEKALYYELMSTCKNDDAPFCDPNCSVKVDFATTIAMTIPFPIHNYLVTVKFSVKVPDSVLAFLERKGLVQSSPGYTSPPTLAIVCSSNKTQDIPF